MEGVAPGAPKRRRPVPPGGADALAHRTRKKPRAERAARSQTLFLSYDVAETAGWGSRFARPFNVPAPHDAPDNTNGKEEPCEQMFVDISGQEMRR